MRCAPIVKRELHSMLLEKSFLLIILLELLLVSSSGLLSAGYVLMTSPESSTTLNQLSRLVYVGVITNTQEPIMKVFTRENIHFTFYQSEQVALEDFKIGLIDAVIVGDVRNHEAPSILKVYIPSNSPKSDLTKLSLKKVFVGLENDLRGEKIKLYKPDVKFMPYSIMKYKKEAQYAEIYYIFTLPLLLFLPTVISGSLAIDSITQDFENKRMLNLIISPLTDVQIVYGKVFATLILSMVQCIVWLLILSLTNIQPSNHFWLLFACLLYTIVFMNCGAYLALVLKKMKAAQILYTFVSMSAISLFSPFANYHPLLLKLSPSHMFSAIALGADPLNFSLQFFVLIVFSVATTVLVVKTSKKIRDY